MRLLSTADDNATIRVTNLSEDTRETDLQELFRPFGSISRIYLAKDKNTGQSKVSARLKKTKTRQRPEALKQAFFYVDCTLTGVFVSSKQKYRVLSR